MVWYDALTLGILLLAAVRGAMKGLIWQVAGIAAIVLCFVFAETLSLQVGPIVESLGVEAPLSRWLSMLVIYLVMSALVFFIARGLKDLIEKVRLTEYDRHLGALFGLLKGVVLCLVLTFFVVTLSPAAQETIRGSFSGNAAAIVMDRLHPVMPQRLHEALDPYIHLLDTPELDLRHNDHADHAEHSHGESDSTHAAHHEPVEAGRPPLPGGGASGEGGSGQPAVTARPGRSDLLRSIAEIYTASAPAQEAIIEEINLMLGGVPENIATAVLEDWHADLTGAERDPDESTDQTSSLDQRILRQLGAFGVELDSLSDALQFRFRELRRR